MPVMGMARPTRGTLTRRLGIKPGHQVVLLGAPERFPGRLAAEVAALDELAGDVRISRVMRGRAVDVVVVFVDCLAQLERRVLEVTHRLHPQGQLWVCWRSRRAGDVREDLLRRVAMAAGLADSTVCAIDGVWTGMRMVWRLENREAMSYRLVRPAASLGLAPHRRTRRATTTRRAAAAGPGSTQKRLRARKRSD